jgi:protein TonB
MAQDIFGGSVMPGAGLSETGFSTSAHTEHEDISHPDVRADISFKKRWISGSLFGAWGIGKSAALSVVLHAVIVALMIVCFAGTEKKHPETITVFLSGDSLPGERDSVSKAPARPDLKHSVSATKVSRNKHIEAMAPEVPKPSVPKIESEPPTSKVATAESSTLSPMSAEKSLQSGTEDVTEGQGRREGTQAGPTYAGTNTNGPGSEARDGGSGGAEGGKNQYLAHNFAYIRELIVKNLKYPYDARRMGWKGSVTVAFVILENGAIEALRVTKSSGYDILDRSVLKTVRTLQPFPKPPTRAELVIPIAFRLE